MTNTIMEFCNGEFIANHYAGNSEDARRGYRLAVKRFSKFLGRDALPNDLTTENLARFWDWSLKTLSSSTVSTAQRRLRTIWRAAFKAGHATDVPPAPWWEGQEIAPAPGDCAERPMQRALLVDIIAPDRRPETLGEYVSHYVLERGLTKRSAKMIRYRLTAFEKLLGRPATLADLNTVTVNVWLARMVEAFAPETVRGCRSVILGLWNAAYDAELVDRPALRIRKIKFRARRPRAWTAEQLATILSTCKLLPGSMQRCRRVARRSFYRALVLTAYYSGLRRGDLLALTWDDISADGLLVVTQRKTGELLTCQLPPDALHALETIHAGRTGRVFGDLINAANLQRSFRRLLRMAGLPGTFKWLRRSGASHVEAITPGAAQAFLGHLSGPGLARKHYLDPEIVQRVKPTPPRIEGPRA